MISLEEESLRCAIFDIAKSEMTALPISKDVVFGDGIDDGGLFGMYDSQNNSMVFNANGFVEDINFLPDMVAEDRHNTLLHVRIHPHTVSLCFPYSWEGVYTPHWGWVNTPPKKVRHLEDVFPKKDRDVWEQKVIERLTKVDRRFLYAWIDYNSDSECQRITLRLSRSPKDG